MPLLPFEKFSFETTLRPSEVHDRLAAAVEPRKMFRFGGGQRPFEGEVQADAFRIERIIRYRNSFLPRIRGRIIPTANGSRVEGSMTLHPLVAGFMVVWIGFVAFIGVGVWSSLLAGGAWRADALLPLGIAAFAWAMTAGGFTYEARKARALLLELLAPSATHASRTSHPLPKT